MHLFDLDLLFCIFGRNGTGLDIHHAVEEAARQLIAIPCGVGGPSFFRMALNVIHREPYYYIYSLNTPISEKFSLHMYLHSLSLLQNYGISVTTIFKPL